MLKIGPNCECCDKDLPPASVDAMICSYECTFCKKCVEETLQNVCPNCGGGFVARPIRPQTARCNGISIYHQPASVERVHNKYSTVELKEFAAKFKHIPPANR